MLVGILVGKGFTSAFGAQIVIKEGAEALLVVPYEYYMYFLGSRNNFFIVFILILGGIRLRTLESRKSLPTLHLLYFNMKPFLSLVLSYTSEGPLSPLYKVAGCKEWVPRGKRASPSFPPSLLMNIIPLSERKEGFWCATRTVEMRRGTLGQKASIGGDSANQPH